MRHREKVGAQQGWLSLLAKENKILPSTCPESKAEKLLLGPSLGWLLRTVLWGVINTWYPAEGDENVMAKIALREGDETRKAAMVLNQLSCSNGYQKGKIVKTEK
jgi:hypothetical protein